MRNLLIYGHSDDLVEIEENGEANPRARTDGEPDEIPAGSRNDVVLQLLDTVEHEGLVVVCHYAPRGTVPCWAIGIGQLDEGLPLPAWPIRYRTDAEWVKAHGYSVGLEIEAPDEVVIEQLWPVEES